MIRSLKLNSIRANLERGRSPLVGIPVVYDGSRAAACFHRRILETALGAPTIQRATYNLETRSLVLSGERSKYILREFSNPVEIHTKLSSWARTQRKSKTIKLWLQAHPNASRADITRANRIREQIAKLQRQSERIYVRRPANHLLHVEPKFSDDFSRYRRDNWARWTAEKRIRKALAGVATVGKPAGQTWAQFNSLIAAIVGRDHLSRDNDYTVLLNRRGGPCFETYLHALPKYLGLSSKPYDGDPWTHNHEEVQRWRLEYCQNVRARREVEEQIRELSAALKDLEG